MYFFFHHLLCPEVRRGSLATRACCLTDEPIMVAQKDPLPEAPIPTLLWRFADSISCEKNCQPCSHAQQFRAQN